MLTHSNLSLNANPIQRQACPGKYAPMQKPVAYEHLTHPSPLHLQPPPPSLPSQKPLLAKPIPSPPAKTCSYTSSLQSNIHPPSSFLVYNCILLLSYCPTPPHSFSFSHYSHFPFLPLILPTCKWYLSFFIFYFILSPSKAASSSWKHSVPILLLFHKILPDLSFSLKKKKKRCYRKINCIHFWKCPCPLSHLTQLSFLLLIIKPPAVPL